MGHGHIRRAVAWGVIWIVAHGVLGPATAQSVNPSGEETPFDARWAPWLGCWSLWQEQFESQDQLRDTEERDAVRGIVGRTSVCVSPAGQGISLRAVEGERLLVERVLVADGARRAITESDCQGWERNEWSTDGQRLFTFGELRCDDGPPRSVTGVSVMASASSWVDLQLVRQGGREQLELRRYTPMPDTGAALLPSSAFPVDAGDVRSARQRSAEDLSIADVVEASTKAGPRVVEALLTETEPDLNINADALIALDDAGIDHGVIDLLVALSYPDRFEVQRRARSGGWASSLSPLGGLGGFSTAYDPIWYDALYPYYVTPFAYNGWSRGYNPYYYGMIASPFVVLPTTPSDDTSSVSRAYRDRGYTRVRPRDAVAPAQVISRGGAGSGQAGTGSRAGSGRGGTATAGGGYTNSGGSSGGTSSSGRRAVPR